MTQLLTRDDNNQAVWVPVCELNDILLHAGVAAKVNGKQVAIFRVEEEVLYAISNFDPFTKANVLSRGIVGSKGGVYKVASPLLKHSFNLETGEYLDDPTIKVPTFEVRVENGKVWVKG